MYPAQALVKKPSALYSRILEGSLTATELSSCSEASLSRVLPLLFCPNACANMNKQSIADALLIRCANSKQLCSQTYYLIHALNPNTYREQHLYSRIPGSLVSLLRPELKKLPFVAKLKATRHWFNALYERKDESTIRNFQADVSSMHLINPLCPDKELNVIQVVKVFKSASKPLLLNLIDVDGKQEHIIFKTTPVIKDCLALCVFSVFNEMWAEEKQPHFAVLYNVLPQAHFGMLECMREVESVQVWDDNYKWKAIEDLDRAGREHFLHTAVGGFVTAFVLGVRDRHKDNMLIRKSREFVMIDFEYLFGLGLLVDAPSIAMSGGMAQCIKNMGNQYWNTFVELCCDAFLILRRKQEHVVNLACQLFVDTRIFADYSAVKNYLLDVFWIGRSEHDAVEILRKELNVWFSLKWWVKDGLHKVHSWSK